MAAFDLETNVPRGEFDFEVVPETDRSFEDALARASAGERLDLADGGELLTTGT
ncbi:MAG: 7,8-didemethyl-8-hydroxy-5-deazariboflavin synthase subunit CofH, partial [Halobacteriales archaeon]